MQVYKDKFDYEVVEKQKILLHFLIAVHGKILNLEYPYRRNGDGHPGKGNMGIECEQNHIINELDIPVSVLGLSNIIVAASPDGILVSEKMQALE